MKPEVPPPGILDRLRAFWLRIMHIHTWQRSNDASEADVPNCYPPPRGSLNYISPRRVCTGCDARQWFVGPEVCGGDHARWVDMPVDFSMLETED